MARVMIMLPFMMIILAGIIAGIYCLIKQLIRYNHTLKNGKTQQQRDYSKTTIDDL